MCDGTSKNDNSSSADSMSESETLSDVRSRRVSSTASEPSSFHTLSKDKRSASAQSDLLPLQSDGRDEIFVPKSSRLNLTLKNKSKFNETILASAAFTAATEPIDIHNEVRWFEGELPTKECKENDGKATLRKTNAAPDRLARIPSRESISSTSTIESLTFDSKSNDEKNISGLNDKNKKLGHYRSKSDQLVRFRPFGTTKPQPYLAGGNESKPDMDSLSTSLPANSDVTG